MQPNRYNGRARIEVAGVQVVNWDDTTFPDQSICRTWSFAERNAKLVIQGKLLETIDHN